MDNVGYLVAGYGLTWGVVAWYAWRLERRSGAARRALESERAGAAAGRGEAAGSGGAPLDVGEEVGSP